MTTQNTFPLDAVAAGLPAAGLIPEFLDVERSTEALLRAVVVAPPGTGKTTVVPPTVANRLQQQTRPGKVIVTQPRRMAARAAARRLAQLTGTQLGDQVGYTVRGDQKTSAATRVEFVTTGVLLRRLMRDPEAAGVSAIVVDEVHERQLDVDLTFAMVQQLGELRGTAEPLDIVVMSATLDADFWADLLPRQDGQPARVLTVEAVAYPLRERWAPLPGTQRALDTRGVTDAFLKHVATTVATTVNDAPDGDVLVFLPGAREIDRVAAQLRHHFGGPNAPEVLPLLGSTPAAEQDRILSPHDGRAHQRIVLATNVAESALTVPGVRTVVDAGLDRQSRLDTGRGVAGLVTVGAAKSAMIQRAGRAAREGPGLVVRCLGDAEFAARPAHTPAEVRTADLTQAVLDLACWGAPDGAGLQLPEPLPPRAFRSALEVLTHLGALDTTGAKPQVTDLGRKLAGLPVDPRLGRGLYDGAEFVGAQLAAETVAALSSDQRAEGADLGNLLQQLRSQRPKRWTTDVKRLLRALPSGTSQPANQRGPADPVELGMVTALAYPQQIARRRTPSTRQGASPEYLLASGTAAVLPHGSGLHGAEWLAIADVTLHGDRAIIRAAAELDQDHAELAAGRLLTDETWARFVHGKVSARAVRRLGAIELSSTPVKPTAEHTRDAVAADIRQAGILEFFNVTAEARHRAAFTTLRGRLGLLHRVLGEPWPDVSDAALTARLHNWLGPEIEHLARGARKERIDLTSALRRLLPWPEASRLDQLAPERLSVPSGSKVRLTWPAPEDHTDEGIASPVLAVKLQECFGWTASPTVVAGRVPVVLHLLSPAQRPLAVTADLANFWEHVYPEVRAQNRGKYVKHPWPADPFSAVATAKTNRALRDGSPRKK